MSEPKDDPITPFPRAIIELFRDDLRKVRFPDVDFDSLLALADELKAAQLEVECAEAALQETREQLRERARALAEHAARGLSYARIFAAGNDGLSERIAEIDRVAPEASSAGSATGKKRGRPRKGSAEADLFAADGASEGAQDEVAA